MKKKSRIPKFKSIEEEAHFWDTHSIVDYEDEMENVEIIFDLKNTRDATLVVRVQSAIKQKLEKLARKKGLNASTLSRMWLIEKLKSEEMEVQKYSK